MKRSTLLPLILTVFLAGMAYVGRATWQAGNRLYYLGVITGTAVVIIALHFVLKIKERLEAERKAGQAEADRPEAGTGRRK